MVEGNPLVSVGGEKHSRGRALVGWLLLVRRGELSHEGIGEQCEQVSQ